MLVEVFISEEQNRKKEKDKSNWIHFHRQPTIQLSFSKSLIYNWNKKKKRNTKQLVMNPYGTLFIIHLIWHLLRVGFYVLWLCHIAIYL